MQQQLSQYITNYGYLVLFAIVLVQELGVPGLPNEFLLFCIGLTVHRYQLSFPQVFLLVIVADIAAASLLYALFYHAGNGLRQLPWLHRLFRKTERLQQKIHSRQTRVLFLGKLTPFIRGYIPVAAGLLQVNPGKYFKMMALAGVLWTGGWFTAGWLLAGG